MWGKSALLATDDFFGKLKFAGSEQENNFNKQPGSLNNTMEFRLKQSIDPDNYNQPERDMSREKFRTDLKTIKDFETIRSYFTNIHLVRPISTDEVTKQTTMIHMLIHKQNICKLALGSSFMVLLTERGEVYKVDEPERGQPNNKLGAISTSFFEGHKVVDIAAGHSYVLFLTSNKQVFSMGIGAAGTLGHGKDVTVQLKPRRIDFQQRVVPEITFIEAGLSHAGALTRTGRVFLWGYGGDGRLGIGNSDSCFHPRAVDQLESESLVGVSCG